MSRSFKKEKQSLSAAHTERTEQFNSAYSSCREVLLGNINVSQTSLPVVLNTVTGNTLPLHTTQIGSTVNRKENQQAHLNAAQMQKPLLCILVLKATAV